MNALRRRVRATIISIIRKLGLYELVFALMHRQVKVFDLRDLSPRTQQIYYSLQKLRNRDVR